MRTRFILPFLLGSTLALIGCGSESPSARVGPHENGTGSTSTTGSTTSGQGGSFAPGQGGSTGVVNVGGAPPDPCKMDPPESRPERCKLVAPPSCGDGEINQASELCDDGNGLPGDCCSGQCMPEAFCACPTPPAAGACASTIVCGDGMVGVGEGCDDGNASDGDGCSANCRIIEIGWICPIPGAACERRYVCSDGSPDPNEGCDDGNMNAGDGCDPRCRIEPNYKCMGAPSMCSPTTCGDGMAEGSESCDDGNRSPFDGCGADCRSEPGCAPGEACTTSCGDGIKFDSEACDDGNSRTGDGCSADCAVEAGYTCNNDAPCVMQNGICTIQVPVVYRDFLTADPDFEPGSMGCELVTPGIAAPLLDAEGKPTLATAGTGCGLVTSAASFATWYRDAPGAALPTTMTLWQNMEGAYVNRWGPNGEQWQQMNNTGLQWCAEAGGSCADCTFAYTMCYDPCTPWGDGNLQVCAQTDQPFTLFDGNPVFFPVDGFGPTPVAEYATALVPQPIYAGAWQAEPGGASHNFHFTSEVKFWFEYDPAVAQALNFDGDDDVWVFLGGELALDLGGIHIPVSGVVDVAALAPTLGLTAGSVYQIAVFQAERQKQGSSYRLTLSGFNLTPSDCVTQCGDGQVVAPEECDLGAMNTGGYNLCTPDCRLGPRCGDMVVQADFGEVCDDGVNAGNYQGCAPNCQLGPYCDDGITQTEFGEQCDDGVNDGGYGECAACMIGPYCGDGNLDEPYESCDDTNNVNHDGCSGGCLIEEVPPE